MINWIDILGVIIALAAFIFAFCNNLRVKKLEENQIELTTIELDEKREEINKRKKAFCDLNIVLKSKDQYFLKVYNKGSGIAFNIKAEFFGDEKLYIERYIDQQSLVLKELEPQKNIDFRIVSNDSTEGPWDYRLTWDNEDKTTGEKCGGLHLPMT